jgi:NAD(P)-dependent dehydrogenase (short-subunit alcohol dehydrogenase family)
MNSIVNAAGVAPEIKNPQPIWAMPDANWTTTMGVNATGVMNCCRAATAQMMRQDPLPNGDRGWVVNLSSIYGQTAIPGNGTYCYLPQTPFDNTSTTG